MNINNNNNIGDIKRLEELKNQSTVKKSDIDVQQEVLNSVFDSANDVNNDKEFGEPTLVEAKELNPFKKAITNLINFFTGNNTNKTGETEQVDGSNPTTGIQPTGELVADFTAEALNDKFHDRTDMTATGNTYKTGSIEVTFSQNAVSAKEGGQDVGGVQKIAGKNGQEFFVLINEDGTKGVFDPKSGEFLSENKAKEMGLI